MNKYLIHLFGKDARIQRGTGDLALENHKAIGFLSNIGQDPMEKYKATKPASIHCWAIIGLPAKCHLNGILLVGR